MYDVIFEETKFNLRVNVRSTDSIEDAMRFALALHSSSNVPHIVSIDDHDSVYVTLLLQDKVSKDADVFVKGIVNDAVNGKL